MSSFQRPRTVAEGVYDYLKEALFADRLGAGRWLREQEIAQSLQVSRTPVREAVRRLAQEGFLDLVPNRGAQVRSITLLEAVEVYEVRDRLEAMAAKLAAEKADASDRAVLREMLAEMHGLAETDFVGQIRADNEFHLALASLAGNSVLADLIERLQARVTRAKVVTRDVNSSRLARAQHLEIVEAIEAGDGDAAEVAMRRHIRMNLDILAERLGPQAGTPVLAPDRPGAAAS